MVGFTAEIRFSWSTMTKCGASMLGNGSPNIYIKRRTPKASKVFDSYWKFAARRQEAFFARIEGTGEPWSDDPIIQEYKFTNAYRASDRVSQYLIKNVIYDGHWSLNDLVLRVLLFKFFNKIETWQLLESQIGEISTRTFDVDRFSEVLGRAMAAKGAIYSAAYIMPSGSRKKYGAIKKHQFHLMLLDSLLKSGFPEKLQAHRKMGGAFQELLSVESIGQFLAYQFVTDLNYSDVFEYSESEYVVPGPGALDGIRKCFVDIGEYNEADVIRMMFDEQEKHFKDRGYEFKSLWGRPLQLIDCQNIFCEVDKYSRVAHPDVAGISGRSRIKQKFKPKHEPLRVWYPPKWGINDKIRC